MGLNDSAQSSGNSVLKNLDLKQKLNFRSEE